MEALRTRGYEVLELVYSTNTCWVYRGRVPSTLLEVAMKVQSFPDLDSLTRAHREIWGLYQLQEHPNVVRLLDYFTVPGEGDSTLQCLVMEWGSKDLMKDTEQRRQNNYPWAESELLHISRSLVQVLAFAERKHICHRDIKPQNIFYDSVRGSVKLGDFGSTAFDVQSANMQMSIVGTPAFMSPEVRNSLLMNAVRVTHNAVKSDVYSLGVTLLTLAKLQIPASLAFSGPDHATIVAELSSVSYGLREMLWDMLNPDAEQRLSFSQLEVKYSEQAVLQHPTVLAEACETLKTDNMPRTQHDMRCEVAEQPVKERQDYELSPLCELRNIGAVCSKCFKFLEKDKEYPNLLCTQCGKLSFCQLFCLQTYIEQVTKCYSLPTGVCENCSGLIRMEDIRNSFGGEYFDRERRRFFKTLESCSGCLEHAPNYELPCRHCFCKKCAKQAQQQECIYCVLCDQYFQDKTELKS